MPLQQKTFENIVTNDEMAHNEQFHLLPQCFQLYSIMIFPHIEIFHSVVYMFSKSSASSLLIVCGKGLRDYQIIGIKKCMVPVKSRARRETVVTKIGIYVPRLITSP